MGGAADRPQEVAVRDPARCPGVVSIQQLVLQHSNHALHLRRLFIYQLVNVYVATLSSTVWGSLYDAINSPETLISLIASTLPSSSVFFINVIITQIFIAIPVRLLRWIQLIWWVILRLFNKESNLTARQLFEGPLAPLATDYELLVPYILFVLCALLLYWVIAPFLPLFATVFFICQYFAFKYQALFVFEPQFETGGSFFYPIFRFSMACLIISSILNIAYVIIKDGNVQGPLMVPIPFIIYYVWDRIERNYRSVSETVAYSRAIDVDNRIRDTSLESAFDPNFFCQPALKSSSALEPFVYRKDSLPLVDGNGEVNPIYWEESELFGLQ